MPGDPATASGWNIYEIAYATDPHAEWRAIREQTPVLDLGAASERGEEGSLYFVSSWAGVEEILRDARHGAGVGVSASFGEQSGLAVEAMQAWLMAIDGAEQTRARGLVRRGFTPARIEDLRPLITETTDRLVSALERDASAAPVDLIERLAFALPSEVIRHLFGFSREAWDAEVISVLKAVDDSPGASFAMIEGLAQAFDRRLARSERGAEDAVPDGLLADLRIPDPELGALSRLEVVANAVLLVTAAIDTTAGLIGNLVHCVLARPEIATQFRADRALASPIVEETLRFEPPALSCSRRAGADFEIEGISIPAGSHLLLGLAAASRDPARHPRPDQFALDRDFRGGLAFGGGRHVCLGATLARLEARVVAERLFVDSGFDFEAIEAPVWQQSNPTVRALERLPLRARPRSA